jgi:hypothetical protein
MFIYAAHEMADSRRGFCADARFAGLIAILIIDPGACAPGFMLTPASQAKTLHVLRRAKTKSKG